MTLIVGLGNPGSQYQKTRHNVGFMLIDLLLNSNFKNVSSSKFKGELFKNGDLLLLKPSTFMNLSGESVKVVSDFYKPSRIVVIHDDMDLNFGAVKFKKGGGNGGHNGLKSIDTLNGVDYERVRIGIGKSQYSGENAVVSHVLGEFCGDEIGKLDQILNYCLKAVNELIKSDIQTVSQKYSTKKAFL